MKLAVLIEREEKRQKKWELAREKERVQARKARKDKIK